MNGPLYDIVHSLALDISNASATENDALAGEAYDALQELCEGQENTELDHPLQWEALGDFAESLEASIEAYQKGLHCANQLNLSEYSASIKLAMAECYVEQDNMLEAHRLATEAHTEVQSIDNNALSMAIAEFIDTFDAPA